MDTQNIVKFLINMLFFIDLAIIFHGILFFKVRIAKLIFLNCLTLLVLLLPYYMLTNGYWISAWAKRVSITGALLLPISYSVMIISFYDIREKFRPLAICAASLISGIVILLYPRLLVHVIITLDIVLSIYILYILTQTSQNLSQRILIILNLINLICTFISISFLKFEYSIILISFMTFITFYILGIEYQHRLYKFITQYRRSNEMIKKLSHQIIRLNQINSQFQNIISQKDAELYQMARHASLAEITSGIAHELAQPLTGIKGIAQNMVDDLNYDDFEKNDGISELSKISSLVDRSTSIINHIRNFSKKNEFSTKNIELNKTIVEAVDLISHQLKENGIELICTLDPASPRIFGDSLSIEQLAVNIILNAKDAIVQKQSFIESFNGRISVTTEEQGDDVELIISDNGIGIPKDILHKIWSPFFTSKKRNRGTGIGLSICSRIIKEHNATVKVDSSGSGTTFAIKFKTSSSHQ